MRKLNSQNERIKRQYLRYLREAKGKSEASLDATRKALARFEDYMGARDFKTFNREQAIGFKEWLAAPNRGAAGEPLSASTRAATLAVLRDFFLWLAWQPGFKSKIHVPDVEYLNLTMKENAVAKAAKVREDAVFEEVREPTPEEREAAEKRERGNELQRLRRNMTPEELAAHKIEQREARRAAAKAKFADAKPQQIDLEEVIQGQVEHDPNDLSDIL